MPYYAVESGGLLDCVLADDPTAACVSAVNRALRESKEEWPCEVAKVFRVAEFGQGIWDQVVVSTLHVKQAGKFAVKRKR